VSASTDLAVMLNHCIEEREELRTLNAELLAALKWYVHNDDTDPDSTYYWQKKMDADALIAKAEALKCST
jgi:hypothetical protein